MFYLTMVETLIPLQQYFTTGFIKFFYFLSLCHKSEKRHGALHI